MLLQIIIASSLLVVHVLSFQPEFAEPIVNISVALGRDAVFTCHVRHLGGYRVGWVKADTKAIQAIHEHVITHNPRVTVSHADANTWNLHMKAVTEEDRGGYMCQLNTDPMKSQIGYLDVVIPPDFIPEDTSSDLFMSEGSSVKLTCRARGYPHPNVTWRREDGGEIVMKDAQGTKQMVTSFSGEVLKLTKLSRSEMGSYLCIASNGVPPSVSKRISLSIHFHPVINVRNQLVGSPLDKDVTIECSVEASPKSINYWIRDTGEMIVSSTKFAVQEVALSLYETHMSVTVKRFAKEDIGSYRCIAKNSQGEVDSSIRLYEIPDPKSTPSKPLGATGNGAQGNEVHHHNNGHGGKTGSHHQHKKPRVTYRPSSASGGLADSETGDTDADDDLADAEGAARDYDDEYLDSFDTATNPPLRRGGGGEHYHGDGGGTSSSASGASSAASAGGSATGGGGGNTIGNRQQGGNKHANNANTFGVKDARKPSYVEVRVNSDDQAVSRAACSASLAGWLLSALGAAIVRMLRPVRELQC